MRKLFFFRLKHFKALFIIVCVMFLHKIKLSTVRDFQN